MIAAKRSLSWLLAAALVLVTGCVQAAEAAHLRESTPLKELADQTARAIERHAFDDADALLARARDQAKGMGSEGRLVLLELDAIASSIELERRNEQAAMDLATAAFDAIKMQFGESPALQSAAALPMVTASMLRSAGAQGRELLDRVEAAMRAKWGDDAEEQAGIEHLRGGFDLYAGDFAAARASYLRSRELYTKHEGPRSLSAVFSGAQAALMAARLGDPDSAIVELQALFAQLPEDPRLRARGFALISRNLGQAYFDAGRPNEMLRTTEQGWIALRDALGEDDPETLESLHGIAANLGSLGRHADALALQRTLLPQFRARYGDVSELVVLQLNNMAFNLYSLGDAAAAVPLLREAVDISTKMSGADHPETVYYTQQLAIALTRSGGAKEALPLLEWVEQKNERAAAPVLAQTRANLYLARAMASGTTEHRAQLVDHANWLAARFGVAVPVTVQTTMRAGLLLAEQGVDREALPLLETAMRGAERQLQATQWVPSDRRALFSRYVDVFRTAAVLHAKQTTGCPRALSIAERARGHGLLEAVTRQRALESSDVPEADRARLLDLVARRERLESEASQAAPGSTERITRDAEASAAATQLTIYEDLLASRYPRFARMRSAFAFDLASGRATLTDDEAFVEFVVASRETLGIVVRRRGPIVCVPLGPSATIAGQMENLRRAIDARSSGSPLLRSALQALSQQLLGPMWRHVMGARRLVISPDGPLAALPFEMLPVPRSDEALVVRREITYAQSLAVHAAIRVRFAAADVDRWPRDLLAFGGPHYTDDVPGAGLAAFIEASGEPRVRGATSNRARAASDALAPAEAFRALGQRWVPLPGAEQEAKAVAALFPKALAITGREATEQRLQALSAEGTLAEYRMLHFATHAYLSTEVPSLSAVVLTLPGVPGADGYVTAAEWPALRLRSELVVLSGCETGLGAEGAGDGVLGLPYALFVAGNRSTVVSLWPVADEATTAFMVAFFKRLRDGESPAIALARTKRAFAADRRYGDPLYWAAFVLYGA